MSLKELAIAVCLSAVYTFLFIASLQYNIPVDIPNWWLPMFGENSYAALAWIHTSHLPRVLAAAFPIAFIIAYFFNQNWLRVAAVAASIPTGVVAFDAIRGHYNIALHEEMELTLPLILSSIIDVIKIGLILILLVYFFSRIIPSNKRVNLDARRLTPITRAL
jgi:hypothetical protein